MTITFVGHGYVGIVTACVFADLGNTVYVIGRTPEKIKKLESGDPIIFEPGLQEVLKRNLLAKRIIFTTDYYVAIPSSEIIFLAVGTPPKENGEADLTSIFSVAKEISKHLGKHYSVISCKSTVPVGTNRKIKDIIEKNKPKNALFDVASCPEFLREGTAVNDTFFPDRVVVGSDSKRAIQMLLKLHKPLPGERIIVRLESAEIIKYASNSILSTKISFANLVSFLCEKTGADVEEVLDGVGLDKRIGRSFLFPGIGYGGSCFPKDVLALIKTGESLGIDMKLLIAVNDVNQRARDHFIEKIISKTPSKNIGIWGLSFKPNTDDIRFAPSIYIIEKLLAHGYKIKAYDPQAMEHTKKELNHGIIFVRSAFDAVKDTDALIILTEWNEFKQINLHAIKDLMKTPVIIDGRNIYDPTTIKEIGFTYYAVGRQ